jgi:hypothetical protein
MNLADVYQCNEIFTKSQVNTHNFVIKHQAAIRNFDLNPGLTVYPAQILPAKNHGIALLNIPGSGMIGRNLLPSVQQ